MNRHDEVGERSSTVSAGGMRRSGVRGEILAMAAALMGAAVIGSDRNGKQESIDDTLAEARRRHLAGEPQYSAEQRAVAAQIQAERQRRKAENWAKRQPKGKA